MTYNFSFHLKHTKGERRLIPSQSATLVKKNWHAREKCIYKYQCASMWHYPYIHAVYTHLRFDISNFIKDAQLESVCLSSIGSPIHEVSKSQDYGQNKRQVVAEIIKALSMKKASVALVRKVPRLPFLFELLLKNCLLTKPSVYFCFVSDQRYLLCAK